MKIKRSKFFNKATRQALNEGWTYNYARQQITHEEIEKIKTEHKLEELFRFDRNINPYGSSPKVKAFQESTDPEIVQKRQEINNCPPLSRFILRDELAKLYNIKSTHIVISTGVDNLIDILSRSIFEHDDYFLSFEPDYPRFEMCSERMSANHIYVELSEEENFSITKDKLNALKDKLQRFFPKILWISNPNNPTGYTIPNSELYDIICLARDFNTVVVVDESLAEFEEVPPYGSCIHYIQHHKNESLEDFPNLVVLKTLSKAYGLHQMPLGFMITPNQEIVESVLLYRPRLIIPNMTLMLSKIAISDTQYIEEVIKRTKKNRDYIFEKIENLQNLKFIESDINTFVFRHVHFNAEELYQLFKEQGILTSPIVSTNSKLATNYLRVVQSFDECNMKFCEACVAVNAKEFTPKQKDGSNN